VRTSVWDKAESETKAAFEELVAALGPAVDTVDLPASLREAWDVHRTIMSVDMAHNLALFFAHGEPSEAMRKLLAHAKAVSAVDYLAALDQARRITAALAGIFDAYDAIITPTAPGIAPKGLSSTGDPVFCTLWTLSGLPSLSLPLLAGSGGLPMGVQLVGPAGRDGRLLRTATALIEMLREARKGKRRSLARSRK
jgi:Asp-tRNA(Asn)/Glu-tRNA(Gln) amidotransferase A subunit family amidase